MAEPFAATMQLGVNRWTNQALTPTIRLGKHRQASLRIGCSNRSTSDVVL